MDKDMNQMARKQGLAKLRRHYETAGAENKRKLIDQAVQLLGYHPKAAIRTLRQHPQPRGPVIMTNRCNSSRDCCCPAASDRPPTMSAATPDDDAAGVARASAACGAGAVASQRADEGLPRPQTLQMRKRLKRCAPTH